jgi:hypothetical protein
MAKLSATLIQEVVDYKARQRQTALVEIEAHLTIKDATLLMHKNNIHSLAVYGAPGHFLTSTDPQPIIHCGKQYIAIITLVTLF